MRYTGTWRAKGLADGAESIDQLIQGVEDELFQLRAMRIDGVGLAAPVEDDYATLTTDDPKVAERYGFGLEENE